MDASCAGRYGSLEIKEQLDLGISLPERILLHLPDHHFRSLLAQFGLTPKSNRGLAASEAVDPLDGV
jgi:hypothetical protein